MEDYNSKFSGEEIDSAVEKIRGFNVINEIPSKSITNDKIADSTIITSLLSNGAVTMPKLGNDVTELIKKIRDKGFINEGRSKQNAIDIKTNQNFSLFNSDRLNLLEAQINADKNTIEYTSDKEIEVTCNGANIIDCNAHFKKVEGQTRRYSLNVFNVPSFDNAQWSYDSNTCTINMKQKDYSEYILPTPFVIAKGTYTMLRTTSSKINTLFYDTEGGAHQISFFEHRKVFNFDKDITIFKIGNNGEVKENYQITLVQGDVPYDTKYFQPYDNTLVNSKATFVSTGRNLYKGGYVTKTPSGMTYTLKGTRLEVSGTPTGLVFDYLTNVTLPKGTYYIGKANMQGTIPGSNYIQINKGTQWFTNEGEFTLNETTTLAICYTITSENAGKQINASFDIMLNVGSTLLPFEPYIESKSVINQELGAYDYIENGNLVKQTSDMITLNGSENWQIDENSPTKRFLTYDKVSGLILDNASINVLTNSSLSSASADSTWNNKIDSISGSYSTLHIVSTSITTVEQLKEWLAQNPITLVYKKATPTITPIVVPNGIVSYKNGLTSQEIKGKYLPYKYTAKYVNGGAK